MLLHVYRHLRALLSARKHTTSACLRLLGDILGGAISHAGASAPETLYSPRGRPLKIIRRSRDVTGDSTPRDAERDIEREKKRAVTLSLVMNSRHAESGKVRGN